MSAIFLIAAVGIYASYKSDLAKFKQIINSEISSERQPDLFVAINHWIYQNQGFKKNQHYFLLKPLGPTPMQVLENGGDCADKSRLLMAMLDAINLDSTLVMLYSAEGQPTHTVVEARTKQYQAVADPVYDLVFPKADQGYFSLAELRNDPAILNNRLDALITLQGANAKIAYYKRENETYQYATTLNWQKNKLLTAIAKQLESKGIEPKNVRRPHFLDDPKLFMAMTAFVLCLLFAFFALIINKRPHERH
ncbi:MAG: hypothetical protein WC782_12520 [Methylococcaceae bacterium]|jgi:hypothetical protein